jgi:hypothetical protein
MMYNRNLVSDENCIPAERTYDLMLYYLNRSSASINVTMNLWVRDVQEQYM